MAALNLVVAVAASESVVASPGSNGGLALPTSLGARQFCRRLWRWRSCRWQRVRVEAGGGSIGRPLLLAVAVPSRRQRFVVLWLEYVCNFFTPCPNYFFAVFDVSWGKVRDGRREIWRISFASDGYGDEVGTVGGFNQDYHSLPREGGV